MDHRNDTELLAEYATSGSDAAFTALVERHSALVHGCALRRTRDPHLAQEVSQTVFLLLAHKASEIQPGTVIAGWLFRATGFVANDLLKQRSRRNRLHASNDAILMNTPEGSSTDPSSYQLWQSIQEHLDELLEKLKPEDRDALLLRYLQGESLASIAVTLKTSEDGARKRVARALEKLRQMLARRGIASSEALLSVTLDQFVLNSVLPEIPTQLAASVLQAKAAGSVVHVTGMNMSPGILGVFQSAAGLSALALGTCAIALTGVALWNPSTSNPIEHPIALPDQTFLEIQKPAYGLNHVVSMSPSTWQRFLDRLPPRLKPPAKSQLPNSRIQLGSTHEKLIFPAVRWVPKGTQPWNLWLSVADSQGREYFDVEQAGMMNDDTPIRLEAYSLTAFPRREKNLHFQLTARPPSGGGGVKIASFESPNPAYGDFPQWTPETLPASSTNGEVVVILDRLMGATRLKSSRVDAETGWHRDAAARVRFMERGQASSRWFVTDVTVADATGNQFTTGLPESSAEGDGYWVPLRGALWPGERAWELTFRLARKSGLAEAEQRISDAVAVPKPGQTITIDEDVETEWGTVSLWSIAGKDAEEREAWKWTRVSGDVVLHLEWHPTNPHGWMDLLEVQDDQGRSVPFRVPNRVGSAQAVGLDPLPGAHQLRFRFGIQKTVEVQWRAAAEPESPEAVSPPR